MRSELGRYRPQDVNRRHGVDVFAARLASAEAHPQTGHGHAPAPNGLCLEWRREHVRPPRPMPNDSYVRQWPMKRITRHYRQSRRRHRRSDRRALTIRRASLRPPNLPEAAGGRGSRNHEGPTAMTVFRAGTTPRASDRHVAPPPHTGVGESPVTGTPCTSPLTRAPTRTLGDGQRPVWMLNHSPRNASNRHRDEKPLSHSPPPETQDRARLPGYRGQ